MSDEEFQEHMRMMKYFWTEKGDVNRYCYMHKLYDELKKRRPDIYFIIKTYDDATAAMNAAMENL